MRSRERKPSETVPADLLRVVKESEELLNGNNVAPGNITNDRTGRMERITAVFKKMRKNTFLISSIKVPYLRPVTAVSRRFPCVFKAGDSSSRTRPWLTRTMSSVPTGNHVTRGSKARSTLASRRLCEREKTIRRECVSVDADFESGGKGHQRTL